MSRSEERHRSHTRSRTRSPERRRDYGDRERGANERSTRSSGRERGWDREAPRDRNREAPRETPKDGTRESGFDRDRSGGSERDRERGWDRGERQGRRREAPSGGGGNGALTSLTPEQQKQLEALQQAEMQRQLQRQQVLLNNGAGGLNAAMAANKKQREVYVGNLVIGGVTDLMLRELFNAALAHFVADPVTRPPVVSTTMDGSGRFGFVELRTEELAAEAMKLDKVNLNGREINVGRPKGYIEPPPGSVSDPNKPTQTLFLENLLAIGQVRQKNEKDDLQVELEEECRGAGPFDAVVIADPPAWVPNEEPAPVFLRFPDEASCQKVKEIMNGRQFELNTVVAKYISDDLWERVRQGEWVDHKLVIDNPAGSSQVAPSTVNHYPNLLPQALQGAGYATAQGAGGGAANAATSGYVVRMSNLPPHCTKYDIVQFLTGCRIGEGHVRLEKDGDGGATGRAFIDAPSAESVARAVAFDRTQMGDTGVFVNVVSSTTEERNQVYSDGLKLV